MSFIRFQMIPHKYPFVKGPFVAISAIPGRVYPAAAPAFARIIHMRPIIALLLFTACPAAADVFVLKDGTRLEGEVAGETAEALQVKTKYGTLTVNSADIQERIAPPPAQPAAPAAELPAVPPAAAAASTTAVSAEISSAPAPGLVAASTAAASPAAQAEISTAGVVAPPPRLTVRSEQLPDGTRRLLFSEEGSDVAAETYSQDGTLLTSSGTMADGTYTEYYPDGALKTVRTMMGGKANGTLKAFYPSGALQAEAYYFVGARDGAFKYFTEDGRPLMTAEYKGDRLNGWKRDYGPDGALAGEAYYVDGRPAAPPGAQASTEAAAALAGAGDSMVTVRATRLARGERFEFRLNGKFAGRLRLDKDYNLQEYAVKLPDGAVKAFSRDGRLEKEFDFANGELAGLRVYDESGLLLAEYAYLKDKAVKK